MSLDQDVYQKTVAQSPRAQLLYKYLVWFTTVWNTVISFCNCTVL